MTLQIENNSKNLETAIRLKNFDKANKISGSVKTIFKYIDFVYKKQEEVSKMQEDKIDGFIEAKQKFFELSNTIHKNMN